jgi:hypothetical protein
MILSEDALRFCWDILRNMPKQTDGDAAGFRVMVSNPTTLAEVFSIYNPVLGPDFVRCSLMELSEKDFTPEVVEHLGAEYFEVEIQKKVSAVRMKRSGLRSQLVVVRLLLVRLLARTRRRGSHSFHRLQKRWMSRQPGLRRRCYLKVWSHRSTLGPIWSSNFCIRKLCRKLRKSSMRFALRHLRAFLG